ncbi:hypothetical protein N7490_009926 [Penicillium lividum]|nr:hypothetical protein N7490_009926 [Penicillium lividum]
MQKSNHNHGPRTENPSNPSSQATNHIPPATKTQSAGVKKQRPRSFRGSKKGSQEAKTVARLAKKKASGESREKGVPDSAEVNLEKEIVGDQATDSSLVASGKQESMDRANIQRKLEKYLAKVERLRKKLA